MNNNNINKMIKIMKNVNIRLKEDTVLLLKKEIQSVNETYDDVIRRLLDKGVRVRENPTPNSINGKEDGKK